MTLVYFGSRNQALLLRAVNCTIIVLVKAAGTMVGYCGVLLFAIVQASFLLASVPFEGTCGIRYNDVFGCRHTGNELKAAVFMGVWAAWGQIRSRPVA